MRGVERERLVHFRLHTHTHTPSGLERTTCIVRNAFCFSSSGRLLLQTVMGEWKEWSELEWSGVEWSGVERVECCTK